ncbi:hypothetical protein LTR84_001336 [Exophiala bonariae]|uniref:Palmitoyltransferase n=1 Tax=Exophiala bonariae TaxID=1690606 RepID=A0AAV9NG25_9EURO|nr:hypothetical protein LTR84_001336 [Exophiala bonariae]
MSSKYAAWARVMTKASGNWLNLCFYIGSVPFLSLLYTTSHLAALQFNGLPVPPYPSTRTSAIAPNPRNRQSTASVYNPDYTSTTTFFILAVSFLHFVAWFTQAILCTACELAPILSGNQGQVPGWCPQSRFQDAGGQGLANMLGTLATVKDFFQWGMVAITIALFEIARREWMRAERARIEAFQRQGAGVDFGGERRRINPDGSFLEMGKMEISGPRFIRPEEIQAAADAEAAKKKKAENLGAPGPPIPKQPEGTGVPENQKSDNYYGNGMKTGLTRKPTLNYMYESRI